MKIFKKENIKIWVLFIATLITGLASYGYLPEQIPIHFNVWGNVDNYGGRLYIFLAPAVILLMLILAEVLRNIDPKKNVYNKFNKQYYLIFFLIAVLMLVIQLYTLAYSFNKNIININLLIPFFIGLLFTFLGYAMPKFKQNYFVGIKTSWTLADEEVWDKTHNFGGKVWFVGGILMMLSSVLPANIKMIVFLSTVVIISLVPIIYSYVIFRRKHE